MADSQPSARAEGASTCATCGTGSTASQPLRRCGSCRTTVYCSQGCQKADWTQHRGTCVGYERKLLYPQLAAYFHLSNDDESYQRIIDSFRLRVEDDYTWGQHNHGVMGKRNPLPDFEDFLDRAEQVAILPHWWNAEKRRACIQRATDKEGDAYIGHSIEKSDIQEFYRNNMMPMELRMAAERVYGGGYGIGQQPLPANYRCRCNFDD